MRPLIALALLVALATLGGNACDTVLIDVTPDGGTPDLADPPGGDLIPQPATDLAL